MVKNKFISIFSLSLFCLTCLPLHALTLNYDQQSIEYTLPPITLFMDSNVLETYDMPPIQLGNITLIPIKEILEALGASYEWKNYEKKIYIHYEDTLMVIEIDNPEVWVNGSSFSLQTPAKIINGKVMVPLRFLSEQMNCEVKWLGGSTREIHITRLQPTLPELPEDLLPEETVPSVPDWPTTGIMPDDLPNTDWPSDPGSSDTSSSSNDASSILSFEHIHYEKSSRPLIKLSKMDLFDLSNLTFTDAYRERQLIIDLNGQYDFLFEEGQELIQDAFIQSIQATTGDTTQIIIHESDVQAYDTWEDESYIYIELMPPTEKYDKILFLDPGHGGSQPGSSANGIVEKALNLKQALAVQALLEQDGSIKVYMSREDDTLHFNDVREELLYRTQLANEIGADYFISMHNNASTPPVSGTEVFYYADDVISKQMAQMTQSNIISACHTIDRGAKPSKELMVLLHTQMPAILIETGFITNETEALNLNSDVFNAQLAQAVYKSILETFNTPLY